MADHPLPPPNPDSPSPLLPPPPPAATATADAGTTFTAVPSHPPPFQPYPQFFILLPPDAASTSDNNINNNNNLFFLPPFHPHGAAIGPSWVFPPAATPTPSPMPSQGPSPSPPPPLEPPPNPKQDPSPKSPSFAAPSKRKRSGNRSRRRVDMSGLFPPPPAATGEAAVSPPPAPAPPPKPSLDESEEIIVINKESTGEAVVGLSAGFPADSLTEEEIDANVVSTVGGIEQVNYILIRNHILARWRENVSHCLAKEPFLSTVPPHCHYLLDSAYSFLVTHGYINFGVAPGIKERIPAEPDKLTVIVVGAGLAGLAAARQLITFGFKVVILEGRKRPGGRVYTKKMEGGNRVASADLGGSVLTGTLGNPLGILAR